MPWRTRCRQLEVDVDLHGEEAETRRQGKTARPTLSYPVFLCVVRSGSKKRRPQRRSLLLGGRGDVATAAVFA